MLYATHIKSRRGMILLSEFKTPYAKCRISQNRKKMQVRNSRRFNPLVTSRTKTRPPSVSEPISVGSPLTMEKYLT